MHDPSKGALPFAAGSPAGHLLLRRGKPPVHLDRPVVPIRWCDQGLSRFRSSRLDQEPVDGAGREVVDHRAGRKIDDGDMVVLLERDVRRRPRRAQRSARWLRGPHHRRAGAALVRFREVLAAGAAGGEAGRLLLRLGLQLVRPQQVVENLLSRPDLLRVARKRFRSLGLNVRSKHDDGRVGWPENGPYDGILVTAGAPALVEALTGQLAPGGVLVAPVGAASAQQLLMLRREADGTIARRDLGPVVFVPLLSGTID